MKAADEIAADQRSDVRRERLKNAAPPALRSRQRREGGIGGSRGENDTETEQLNELGHRKRTGTIQQMKAQEVSVSRRY